MKVFASTAFRYSGADYPYGTQDIADDSLARTLIAAGYVVQSDVPQKAAAGSGVPAGGTSGQVLKKNSATDGDASWAAETAATPVVNDLTTGGTTSALSAEQGKALQTAKAPLASPTFTGTPAAPTPTQADNSTKLATTAYVDTLGAGKADLLAGVLLTVSTAITHSAHCNRPCRINQAGATTMTFAAAATSGAVAGDGFELLNEGAGTVTAAGAITAASGYKLTVGQGETFTALYAADSDSWYSTTLALAAGADAAEVSVASAATTDIGAAASPSVLVTGTVTITSLGTVAAGTRRTVRFAGALLLTYNATSLILPGSQSIVTQAGDCAECESLGSGNWVVRFYGRAKGGVVVYGSSAYTPIAPGAGNNQVISRITIPANALAPNGKVRVYALFSRTGTTDSIGTFLKIGPAGTAMISLTSVSSVVMVASTVRLALEVVICGNRTDRTTVVTQQHAGQADAVFTSANCLTPTLDTTAAWDIAAGGNATATDTWTLLAFEAEVSNPV